MNLPTDKRTQRQTRHLANDAQNHPTVTLCALHSHSWSGTILPGLPWGCRPIRPATTAHAAYYPRRSYQCSRARSTQPRLGCCADRWCSADSSPATLPHQTKFAEGGYDPPAGSAETSPPPGAQRDLVRCPGGLYFTTCSRYPHPLLPLLHQFSRSFPHSRDL